MRVCSYNGYEKMLEVHVIMSVELNVGTCYMVINVIDLMIVGYSFS